MYCSSSESGKRGADLLVVKSQSQETEKTSTIIIYN